MRMRSGVALVAVSVMALTGCSQGQLSPDAEASLNSRVASVEDRLAGVEAVVGQALIAEPAKQVQADLDQLERDIASAEVPADVQADLDAAKKAVADAQAAAEAAIKAEEAEDAATAEAVAAAQKAIADAQAKVQAVKDALAGYLATASPKPTSASPSPSASSS